jgi:hypothetical protein
MKKDGNEAIRMFGGNAIITQTKKGKQNKKYMVIYTHWGRASSCRQG